MHTGPDLGERYKVSGGRDVVVVSKQILRKLTVIVMVVLVALRRHLHYFVVYVEAGPLKELSRQRRG